MNCVGMGTAYPLPNSPPPPTPIVIIMVMPRSGPAMWFHTTHNVALGSISLLVMAQILAFLQERIECRVSFNAHNQTLPLPVT